MDEVQVHIVQLQFLEASVDGFGNVADVGEDLGRHEELGSVNLAFFDGDSHFGLVVVRFGAVEVVIAELDGCLDALDESPVDAA